LGDVERGKVKDSRSGSCANHQGSYSQLEARNLG